MQLHGHTIAVCSWSLRPKSTAELADAITRLGLSDVQLALAELSQLDPAKRQAELAELTKANIRLTGGMLHFAGEDYASIARIRDTGGFIPDAEWPARKAVTADVAKLAAELKAGHVVAHVGFVPPHADKAGYQHAVARVREVAKLFAASGVALHMETGQEPAADLLAFLGDLAEPNVFINFDPANMILYGAGDPIAAVGVLGKHIKHVHAKDGTASAKPGVEWGAEVPFGTGQVNIPAFLAALKANGYAGPLAIEREAGENRAGDIAFAIETLRAAGL